MVATIAWNSATMGQGGTSNLQGFQAQHPPTYMGGGDLMVRTTLAIGRGVDNTRSIGDMGASTKTKENQSLLIRDGIGRLLFHRDFKDGAAAIRAKAKSGLLARRGI